MEAVSLKSHILEHNLAYRLWQAPFAEQKFAPILAHNDLSRARRVLDVACGPGTNTHHFAHTEYLGIDYNERYIQDARRRHNRSFVVADARTYAPAAGERFDFVLVNSFLHHLNNDDVKEILLHLRSLLAEDGRIHILELVLPNEASVARLLARWDRGQYARPLAEWRDLLSALFEPVRFEPYRLTGLGATLWNMVYFQGRARK